MIDWRDIVLKEFPRQVAKLTLVADPDGLLTEEGILHALQERGFDLIPFDDSIAFRYAYESRYRQQWDRGISTDLVVVLRSTEQDLRNLPFDLYTAGRKIAFDLTDVFPSLSYPVVDELGRSHFDALYRAQQQEKPGRLGSNQTRDFILLHVFELQPKLIKHPAHLLRELIRLHYRSVDLPPSLARRVVEVLRQSGAFEDWPLDIIVSDRAAFYVFLQERWDGCVRRTLTAASDRASEDGSEYGFRIPGPFNLPFDHDDVRVYLDNLFAEGLLEPVNIAGAAGGPDWMLPGLSTSRVMDVDRRMRKLNEELWGRIPGENAKHGDWLSFAARLGELRAMEYDGDHLSDKEGSSASVIHAQAEDRFVAWAITHYAALFNQPPDPPVMVHHVPKFLSGLLSANPRERVAFLLVDGLSLGQWVSIRQILRNERHDLQFNERAVFAWVPTLTCISRQAAFAGKIPQYFPNSIETTAKDESAWRQFWADRGLASGEVAFAAGGDDSVANVVDDMAGNQGVRAAAITLYTVDEIMHGVRLGMSGMFGQVRQWASQGLVRGIVDKLLSGGFRVFLGSDHGNVEAVGIGSPREGAIADTKGQRVRVYPDEALRCTVSKDFPDAVSWQPQGLPVGYFPLLAPTGKAFTQKASVVVTHGGVSIEEVIVPFIEIAEARK